MALPIEAISKFGRKDFFDMASKYLRLHIDLAFMFYQRYIYRTLWDIFFTTGALAGFYLEKLSRGWNEAWQ
jgi:hypothetical protein